MKIKIVASFISFLFLAAAACAQSNTCAYTFTYTASQFSFCVTVWGTLASIQSPIGVNHLDPANPVEGWSAYIADNGGGHDGGTLIPGLGATFGSTPPPVLQPNGPGTLPLIFLYDTPWGYREIVNAAPNQRVIIMAVIMSSCFNCVWFGTISRVANIRADGTSTSSFAHSGVAAFGYNTHGVMLSVTNGWCAGTDPNGASIDTYMDCSNSNTPFNGPGAVFGVWVVESDIGKPVSSQATYRVF